ncbi:MAG: YibE/F family protein, partial [Clostridium sp.]|nr:YibE/F family protein [Clostridium sp.]
MKLLFTRQKSVLLSFFTGLLLICILIAIPTGFEDALIYQGTERAVGRVVETDNSAIITSGMIQSGEQTCTVIIENGLFEGRQLEGVNFLSGSLEKDKIYKIGDKALLTISYQGNEIRSVVMSDHYRLTKEIVLLLIFAVFLVLFAGKNGFQAILSFLITILTIWKILVPCYLKGYSPVWVGIFITAFLTLMIIFFVYGIDRRTVAATSGALLGVLTTCILGILFTDLFQIHGAIMPNAESL